VTSSIELYWLPLGAGGHFVAFNGRVYEAVAARREHRLPLALYHTALKVTLPEGRFVIENSWPIPDAESEARGVEVEGPVGFVWLGGFRAFRYEIRRWRDGTIADVAEAVGGGQRVNADETFAHRVLELVPDVPPLLWGRKPLGAGEMWNSNSVISWLLARSGVDMDAIEPPPGGRAPGWSTGIELARMPTAMQAAV
jgi:hypothetical protein